MKLLLNCVVSFDLLVCVFCILSVSVDFLALSALRDSQIT